MEVRTIALHVYVSYEIKVLTHLSEVSVKIMCALESLPNKCDFLFV